MALAGGNASSTMEVLLGRDAERTLGFNAALGDREMHQI